MMTGVTFDPREPGARIEPSSEHPVAAVLGKDLVVRSSAVGERALPRLGELPPGHAPDLLGTWYGAPVWGMAVTEPPSGFEALRWSGCLSQPDAALTGVAARAIQVVRFRAEHRRTGVPRRRSDAVARQAKVERHAGHHASRRTRAGWVR